ncbi:hypothetical protein [Streptomyces sp. SAJ15]|uniref:hypothetical protein n=1 Tax=Streptomyces sp. SAJ15 TaxID=2011095 RepID=UPI001186C9D3|nr:hypothetical protein [Streptomyces sp. SAJ15]TVL93551.1 hypothetical protein CD790_00290 [Streptomyces sp. SAJ15]
MSTRRIARKTLLAGGAAAALLSLSVAAVPALASGDGHQSAAGTRAVAVKTKQAFPETVSGSPSSPLTRVGDFFGAYIDARNDEGGAALASALRKHYLSAGLQKELAAWAKKNGADGVLRAQNVPTKWSVTDNGNGDNYSALVKLAWADGSVTKLDILAAHDATKIIAITPVK